MVKTGKKNGGYSEISREDLVKKHVTLVNFIVGRLAIGLPHWMDSDDLISAGIVGLIDAANNFDHSRGVKFETYAYSRIRGAIMDNLRSMDWIPRTTRSESKRIERAIEAIEARKGRPPTDEELAKELDWTLDKYYKTLQKVSSTTVLSLDEFIKSDFDGRSTPIVETVKNGGASALEEIEKQEILDIMIETLEKLSEPERLVVALYYYEELTLKEIGTVLDITESRVSQIHSAAIHKLRARVRTKLSR